jgi:hypothetical protein
VLFGGEEGDQGGPEAGATAGGEDAAGEEVIQAPGARIESQAEVAVEPLAQGGGGGVAQTIRAPCDAQVRREGSPALREFAFSESLLFDAD